MSMTMKLNVSFPMTIVVSTETIKDFEATREEARKIPAEKIEALKGETKFRAELFRGDKSTEDVFELIYRAGIREHMSKDFREEIGGNEANIRLGSVKVEFAAQCHRCAHNETCIKVARFGCIPVTHE